MSYFLAKTLTGSFEDAVQWTTEALAREGFGVITQIDVKETFRKKLDIDFRNYRILGACNPSYAHEAIQIEDKIGTMLPCNVVVQETAADVIEVAAVDPVASMMAIDNPRLKAMAGHIRDKLRRAIESL
ncbi:MAG: DUF302 domain-containing protein [Alphaproteobacteria bacterium]|nr:DUF302 domain-containing protein [Alphaproteobacteria bacterium]